MTSNSVKVNVLLPMPSSVLITVVDLSGRVLIRQSIAEHGIGQHEYLLGLRENIADKVYFVKVETPQYSKRMKVISLR